MQKCHAGHAKQHYNLIWHLQKGYILQLPPIDTAKPEENQRLETRRVMTCWSIKTSISCETSSNFDTLQLINVFRINFPSTAHRTKRHACHGICTLSPLHAALTMRFSQIETQDTSKVLRLPRKITMMVPKVLRLPGKMQLIYWKRCKSIATATQKRLSHVTKHVWTSRSATPATRNEATRRLKPPNMTPFAELNIGTAIQASRGRPRTVADGCGRKCNVERSHPQPPDPESETGTLATHSEKRQGLSAPRLKPMDGFKENCLA